MESIQTLKPSKILSKSLSAPSKSVQNGKKMQLFSYYLKKEWRKREKVYEGNEKVCQWRWRLWWITGRRERERKNEEGGGVPTTQESALEK